MSGSQENGDGDVCNQWLLTALYRFYSRE